MAVTRKRRSGIERRSLSKAAKRMFMGSSRSVMRAVYLAECHFKAKKPL